MPGCQARHLVDSIDRISLDTHRLSKRAKDLGSAAVLISLVLVAVTWALLAVPAIPQLLHPR